MHKNFAIGFWHAKNATFLSFYTNQRISLYENKADRSGKQRTKSFGLSAPLTWLMDRSGVGPESDPSQGSVLPLYYRPVSWCFFAAVF